MRTHMPTQCERIKTALDYQALSFLFYPQTFFPLFPQKALIKKGLAKKEKGQAIHPVFAPSLPGFSSISPYLAHPQPLLVFNNFILLCIFGEIPQHKGKRLVTFVQQNRIKTNKRINNYLCQPPTLSQKAKGVL